MKLLLFSDLHCSQSHADKLVRQSQSVDLVIGAGDFGNLRRGIDRCIGWLAAIERPAILVPGNSESFEELQDACRDRWPSATVLHGLGTEIEGISFFGVGGGIPVTPFGSWSYDFSEEEGRELLADCPSGGVLVSHSPPKGILDVSSRGLSLGSVAVREVIDEKSPRLVVCGHIHESAGKSEVVGKTTVINAGPAGMILEF
jgi:Icc-related predicted phosphoesterase